MSRAFAIPVALGIGATIGLAAAAYTQPAGGPYPSTITCRAVAADDLAPEAIDAIDRLSWQYPAERILIDAADGSVRALPIALVPPPCQARGVQEDEVLLIER